MPEWVSFWTSYIILWGLGAEAFLISEDSVSNIPGFSTSMLSFS